MLAVHTLPLALLAGFAPIGIDFSGFPVGRDSPPQFKVWVTVYAANGKILDDGEWNEFLVPHSREEVLETYFSSLKVDGCTVARCGDVVIVNTFRGAPVTRVTVKTTAPQGPKVVWVPRQLAQKK